MATLFYEVQMKTCPKCSEVHEKPGTFCSRKCANGRIFKADSNLRRSQALQSAWKAKDPVVAAQQLSALNEKRRQAAKKKLETTPTEELGYDGRRKKVILEQQGKCNHCGLDQWMGKDLVLELEHKDGNKRNNVRENLEALCPNCHSLTPTWRGRNPKYL